MSSILHEDILGDSMHEVAKKENGAIAGSPQIADDASTATPPTIDDGTAPRQESKEAASNEPDKESNRGTPPANNDCTVHQEEAKEMVANDGTTKGVMDEAIGAASEDGPES